MILICRFRRSLVNAQTNRFALRLRETVPGEESVRLAGVYAYWTLVVLRLGCASRANAPQLFSAKGAAFNVSLGQRPRIRRTPKQRQR